MRILIQILLHALSIGIRPEYKKFIFGFVTKNCTLLRGLALKVEHGKNENLNLERDSQQNLLKLSRLIIDGRLLIEIEGKRYNAKKYHIVCMYVLTKLIDRQPLTFSCLLLIVFSVYCRLFWTERLICVKGWNSRLIPFLHYPVTQFMTFV